MLSYPDGLPYSHAIRDYRKEFRASSWLAGRELHKQRIDAQISGAVGNAYTLKYLFPKPMDDPFPEKYLGAVSGYKRYASGSSSEVYYGPADSPIQKILCFGAPLQAELHRLCTHYVVLNNNLHAKINFVDFRVNGGIAFAEERVRVFLDTVCPYLICGEKTLRNKKSTK